MGLQWLYTVVIEQFLSGYKFDPKTQNLNNIRILNHKKKWTETCSGMGTWIVSQTYPEMAHTYAVILLFFPTLNFKHTLKIDNSHFKI